MQGVLVNLVKVDLKNVLQSTFQVHQAIAAEKGIQLINQLQNDIFIIADADMLQLVVRNLINNAIKFTEPGGEIIVSNDIVRNYCRIIVKDTGTGVDIQKQKSIFSMKISPGYGTKNEKGFGLGLVLCKEFTELQNGTIAFESAPGAGSVFYLSFKLYHDTNDTGIACQATLVKKA